MIGCDTITLMVLSSQFGTKCTSDIGIYLMETQFGWKPQCENGSHNYFTFLEYILLGAYLIKGYKILLDVPC